MPTFGPIISGPAARTPLTLQQIFPAAFPSSNQMTTLASPTSPTLTTLPTSVGLPAAPTGGILRKANATTPLGGPWTYWWCQGGPEAKELKEGEDKHVQQRPKPYEERLRQLLSFSAVEHFWGMYNALKRPSQFPMGHDLAVMRRNIRPMWEDPENNRGGRWVLYIPPSRPDMDSDTYNAAVDRLWLDTVLMLIGEILDPDSRLVNGAVLSLRRQGHRLSVWLARSPGRDKIVELGHRIKDNIGIGDETYLFYEYSQSIMKSRSARRRTPQAYRI